MTQDKIFERLRSVIERNVPRVGSTVSLSLDTNLDQLGIDSARRIDILLDTEDSLGTRIDEREFAEVRSLRDLVELVERGCAPVRT